MIYPLRVYIEDTDMMGIVYHSNYLKFFERARTEWLHQNGLTLTNMAKYNTYFAVHHLTMDFKAPARLEDKLKIESVLEKARLCQASFQQRLLNEKNDLLVEAFVNIVCVDEKMMPKRLPKAFFKGEIK